MCFTYIYEHIYFLGSCLKPDNNVILGLLIGRCSDTWCVEWSNISASDCQSHHPSTDCLIIPDWSHLAGLALHKTLFRLRPWRTRSWSRDHPEKFHQIVNFVRTFSLFYYPRLSSSPAQNAVTSQGDENYDYSGKCAYHVNYGRRCGITPAIRDGGYKNYCRACFTLC